MSGFVSSVSRNRWLLFSLLIVFGIGILAYMGYIQLPFTIISVSPHVELIQGKYYTVATITLNTPEKVIFNMKWDGDGSYTLANGTTIEGKKEIAFTFEPQIPKCRYTLRPNKIDFLGYNIYTYYEMGTLNREQQIKVSSTATPTQQIIDNYDVSNQITLRDTLGDGFATVEAQGAFIGKTDCPPSSDYLVLNRDNVPQIVNKADFLVTATNLLGTICSPWNPLACFTDFEEAVGRTPVTNPFVFTDYCQHIAFGSYLEEIKTDIYCVPKSNKLGNPVLTITADEQYFDSIRFEPPTPPTKPIFVSFTSSDIEEGTSRNYMLIVRNPSQYVKTFTGRVSTNLGSITPRDFTIRNIQPYSEAQVWFSYNAPSVTSDTSLNFAFEVCDYAQTGSLCESKTYISHILNREPLTPPPPLPPEPEPTPVVADCSDIVNSHLVDNRCICNDGFATKFDTTTGEMYCEKPTEDWLTYVIYGTTAIIFIGGGYMVYKSEFKRKRR